MFTPTRRTFLRGTALILAGPSVARVLAAEAGVKSAVRVGLLTDVHYSDKNTKGSRHYRDSLGKLREAVEHLNTAGPDFVTHLGDLIDSAPTLEEEIGYLKTAEVELNRLRCDRHYVLGNHCVTGLTKQEFMENSAAKKPFYSFDHGGFHFVVLDACFKRDGTAYGRSNFDFKDTVIPPHELAWLGDDLTAATKPVVIFAHQRLDLEDRAAPAVKNASAVRGVLEKSGKVRAVFQGHTHKNEYQKVGGIHYCTLIAVIEGNPPENSGAAVASFFADGSIRVEGFRRQASYDWG